MEARMNKKKRVANKKHKKSIERRKARRKTLMAAKKG